MPPPRNVDPHEGDVSAQFHLKQFECLRKEIEWNLDQLRKLELYSVVATGGIWGFIISRWEFFLLYPWLMVAAAILPIPLVVCGYFRFMGTVESIERIAGYIRQHIEPRFAGEGWEHYLSGPAGKNRWRWVKRSEWVVWIGLLAANLVNIAVVSVYSHRAAAGLLQSQPQTTAAPKK